MHISILPIKDSLNLNRLGGGGLLLTAAAPPDGKQSKPVREHGRETLRARERRMEG